MGCAVPDDIIECSLLGLDVASIGCCCAVSSQWRAVGEQDELWLNILRFCGKPPYRTIVTQRGAETWLVRQLGGDILPSRGHLQRLQQSRKLKQLFQFLHCFHNGVEVEPQIAKPAQVWYNGSLANATVAIELLNFWPHNSWVWLRPAPIWEPTESVPLDLKLQGSARVRCWDDAKLPPGRLGDGMCFLLDCGSQGEVFRLPPLSNFEIGLHKLVGPVDQGHMRLECAMGLWPDDSALPLSICSADAFLQSTKGDSVTYETAEDAHDIFQGLQQEWLEGHSLPEACSLGPLLYWTVVDLDLSSWL